MPRWCSACHYCKQSPYYCAVSPADFPGDPSWILLMIAGLFEIVWASALPETDGLTRPGPTLLFVSALGASMYLLAVATRTIPLSTGYAVWVGIGAVGTATWAIVVRDQRPPIGQVLALAVSIGAIVAVKPSAAD